MWTWDQSEGNLSRDGVFVSAGYSGNGRGKNNPSMQDAVGVGPVPRGKWKIGKPYLSQHTGPYTLALDPCEGTDVCGRFAFRIHGDSIKNPGTASHGCIILPRFIREKIWQSGDHDLMVVA